MIQHVALPSRIPITALRILLEDGWLVVGIPLLWGVLQTLSNAIKLFQ